MRLIQIPICLATVTEACDADHSDLNFAELLWHHANWLQDLSEDGERRRAFHSFAEGPEQAKQLVLSLAERWPAEYVIHQIGAGDRELRCC